jgi:hypothetical protein
MSVIIWTTVNVETHGAIYKYILIAVNSAGWEDWKVAHLIYAKQNSFTCCLVSQIRGRIYMKDNPECDADDTWTQEKGNKRILHS